MIKIRIPVLALAVAATLLAGCAHQVAPYDYTAFRQARPASLLVLPPVNDSPDVKATPSVWAQATQPLAEAGYYVLPVTLVDETLRQNGIQTPNDAQDIPRTKLREVFGADAAVYIRVTRYGTAYHVLSSDTEVAAEARIVDLRSGTVLWQGRAIASSAEQGNGGNNHRAVLLVAAVVRQIVDTSTDAAYGYAGIADARLLGTSTFNGVLPGPRSPAYGKEPATH